MILKNEICIGREKKKKKKKMIDKISRNYCTSWYKGRVSLAEEEDELKLYKGDASIYEFML